MTEVMTQSRLLTANDPAPVTVSNPDGRAPVVIVCDHAGQAVPEALFGLGVQPGIMERHIAYDIGAQGVADYLSRRLDAPAVIGGYSRLVIDINRPVDDFTSIREISDGDIVPGNRNISAEQRKARQDEIYWPYHERVADAIASRHEHGRLPAIISVHSCTDQMRGAKRPWHIGVLMNRDRRMGEALMKVLAKQRPDLCIGDNKPYSGMDPYGYTIETHALPGGLPNVLLEIRQDLIRTEAGQQEWGEIVGDALEEVLADPHVYTAYQGEARLAD
ncbi:N-formylglutamate amidohydrolase [Aestuariispira insulae]|uniref:Putative N-formylglutamate amidohydrolase n=1 Tax=Aestuariispira insulae TaxID=1461337 RepID=A0A3D9HX13_9PROT|nr:N-formylglutamate amidohydrolase [Aestuariispira insulae]RED54034.1 putative N-formylglutamate amidohydrolase [Aestuariispira insulae]